MSSNFYTKRLYFLVFILLLAFFVQAQSPEAEIRKVMADQEECWNSGDLECFMEGYWKSDKLVFIGSKGLTYGWQNTLDNYKTGYPDRATMGKLKFELKVIEPIEGDHWFVIGKWALKRDKGDVDGHFSLIWRNIDNEWVIVADHSS